MQQNNEKNLFINAQTHTSVRIFYRKGKTNKTNLLGTTNQQQQQTEKGQKICMEIKWKHIQQKQKEKYKHNKRG